MGALVWRARAGGLLLAGAVIVHHLVYGLAGVPADQHAHGYLAWATPALFGLVLVLAAELVVRALRIDLRPIAPPPSARVLWPALAAVLLGAFAAQEATEALVANGGGGHTHALQELVLAHGLWIAVPVALAVGGMLALLLRGAAAVAAWRLEIVAARPAAPAPPTATPRSVVARRTPRDLLGRHLAGRAPPLVAQ